MTDLPLPDNASNDKEAMKHAKNAKHVGSITDSLPNYTKDPKNFMKIQKALLNTLSCGKAHSDPVKMAECAKCTENMRTRRELMQKFGFKSSAQYMAWRKTHEEIRKMMPLVDWEKGDKGVIKTLK